MGGEGLGKAILKFTISIDFISSHSYKNLFKKFGEAIARPAPMIVTSQITLVNGNCATLVCVNVYEYK